MLPVPFRPVAAAALSPPEERGRGTLPGLAISGLAGLLARLPQAELLSVVPLVVFSGFLQAPVPFPALGMGVGQTAQPGSFTRQRLKAAPSPGAAALRLRWAQARVSQYRPRVPVSVHVK